MAMMNTKSRPKHLNLFKVRLPVAGIASILHRISGAFLFLATPFLLYILTTSLKNNRGFEQVGHYFDSPLVKLVSVILIWSVVHHFMAGIRYLVLDLEFGLSKKAANRSAMIVILASLAISIWLITRIYQ